MRNKVDESTTDGRSDDQLSRHNSDIKHKEEVLFGTDYTKKEFLTGINGTIQEENVEKGKKQPSLN